MKISKAIDFLRTEADWTWSAVVILSWLGFGAAVYFISDQAGLWTFPYTPNDLGIISPTTMARVPKAARVFHFVVGTGFTAFMGMLGWWLWIAWCSFVAPDGAKPRRQAFSSDAWTNVALLTAFVNVLYKVLDYGAAVILSVLVLTCCRIALLFYFRTERADRSQHA
jgi:hypothetical protein